MKRSMYGTLALGAALLAACAGDPTSDQRNGPDELRALPGFLTIALNTSELVQVQLVDDQGNALPATFSGVANNPAVIAVTESTSFRPGLEENRLLGLFRVAGNVSDSTSVTFTAGGKSVTVPVVVDPAGFPLADMDVNAPAVGAPVVISAPGNIAFGAGTVVTFRDSVSGQQFPAIVQSFTNNTITVVPIPGAEGIATISGVTLLYSPQIGTVTITTNDLVDVPAVNPPLSTTTPDINDLVTVSPTDFIFTANSRIIYRGTVQVLTAVAPGAATFRVALGNGTPAGLIYENVELTLVPGVEVTVSGATALTASATIQQLSGTDAIATAPTIGAMSSGDALEVSDLTPFNNTNDCLNGPGGWKCRLYAFTLDEDVTFDVTSSWNNASDIGIYFSDAALTDVFTDHDCDAHGAGAGNFESCAVTLTAGTYYMHVVTYAEFYGAPNNVDAANFTVRLVAQ